MSLFINHNHSNGVPTYIYQAIRELEPEFTKNWSVSVIADQPNECWELKLTPEHGEPRRQNLYPEHQNAQGVQQALRALRDEVSVASS